MLSPEPSVSTLAQILWERFGSTEARRRHVVTTLRDIAARMDQMYWTGPADAAQRIFLLAALLEADLDCPDPVGNCRHRDRHAPGCDCGDI